MTHPLDPKNPDLRGEFYRLYRDFFDRAERKRRWSVADDIPWTDTNKSLDPRVADVVEAFCTVEMYLPDYVGKALPLIRANRGWAWFHANWGYEESKHSLALGDWLLRSGHRTPEQMADMEHRVFEHEWHLPEDSPAGMIVYAMAQELATWVNYRNLRHRLNELGGDPCLAKLLDHIAVDERAHHAFYLRVVQMFLKADRATTLEAIRRVLLGFAMPAVHLIADGAQRAADIRALKIFDDDIYLDEVFRPIVDALGLSLKELRRPKKAGG
jgi:acyl-[acyl-carrier-protein] desaturase